MQYRGPKFKKPWQKKPQRPIRLAFGLIEDSASKNEVSNSSPTQEIQQFEKQEIIGTLYLNKTNLKSVKSLPSHYLNRLIKNIDKIYEAGRFLKTNNIIDAQDENVLTVSFSFNQMTVDRLRGLDRNERQWDPELKVWRVFVGCFDAIFDILGSHIQITESAYLNLKKFLHSSYYAKIARTTYGKLLVRESWFEEIELSGISEFKSDPKKLKAIQRQIQKFSFKRTPYSHQISGIEFLLERDNCALLDEMGCGKSFQIASAIALMFKNKSINRALIVCPKSLVHTWKTELSLATDTEFQIISGTPPERAEAIQSSKNIFIIHYEGLRLEKESLGLWLKQSSAIVVFDESQRIKNFYAQTTIAAKYVRSFAKRCIIATGTPISNRPLDLFSQYYVMDEGHTFGGNFQAFKNTFCVLDILEIPQGRRKIRVEKFVSVKNGDELRRRIHMTSLRRLKSEVLDLPSIIYKDYVVEMKGEQQSLYMKVRDNVRSEIQSLSESELRKQASYIMVRLIRLCQLASNPFLLDPNYDGPNAKSEELDNVINDVFLDDTKKIIVWSYFVENVQLLTEKYKEKYGAVSHTGNMNIEHRMQSVKEFQDNPECRLFIATPQSAKEGLTLLPTDGVMKADTMIYVDMNFDSGSYVQSQARFHRIGQDAEKCLVIHLLAQGSIDEYIKRTIMDKLETAKTLLDSDAIQPEKVVEDLLAVL